MGTVGLSFGSPTSGTGFNVSSTVSTIVANLDNVETPWKNQLSSLESQDTVLSNLGTLFSNLSNDISALTDFQGVLSLMEGSSSNNDVLELTSASSTAAAGTYTVAVNSLATTASGYLDSIASASDKLSGAIEINGTTIDVPAADTGNDNLQGLANAITSAGIGVTANVLTDAGGSRLVLTSNTSGSGGSLSVVTSGTDSKGNALGITDTTNSNTALNYNSVISTGSNASLTVNGVALSSASNTVSNLIPGVTFELLGTTVSGAEVQVVIGNDTSSVESTLNQFMTDYNSLVSAINQQDANDASGNPEPLFGSPTLSTLQQDLLSSINYENPGGSLSAVSSTSDTLSGSITINGTTIDMSSLSNQTINGLASAINSSSAGVTANVVNNGTGPQLVLVADTSGDSMTVSSALTDATTSAALSYTSNGAGISALTSLGFSMNNDGSISLDETSLSNVLNSDFSGVQSFFQDANSWGMTFSTMLNDAGNTNPVGVLTLAQSSNHNTESTLNANISRQNLVISAQQVSLTTELNSANEILQELPSQLQGVNEMYSAISGYNESQSG